MPTVAARRARWSSAPSCSPPAWSSRASPTGMPMVIAGRAIQGFGSGAIGSVVYAAIARAYAAVGARRA